jgi:acetylornithine/succinyldiaminopimelate/putrescine aminotransferase
MIGVEFKSDIESPSPLLCVLSSQGLLAYVACGYLLSVHRIRVAPTLSKNNVIRLEPSCFISVQEIERFLQAFETLLTLLKESDIAGLLGYLAKGLGLRHRTSLS